MKESILITIKNKFSNIVLSISSSEKNLFEKIITNKKNKHFIIKENDGKETETESIFEHEIKAFLKYCKQYEHKNNCTIHLL